uniref:F-box and WD repeat domain containing 5 n=1 Tax=Gasterosteus aculeatus TaxID=69293 RepID=G3PWT3_GASAC
MERGPVLPDSLVLEIFLRLPHDAVLRAGLTCRQWLAVSRDEFLWRELFYSYYRIPRSVPRHPAAASWYREFRRLFDCIPCVEVQTLREHTDQVLHLAFSHKGHRFSSCSKDCTVKDVESENVNVVKRLFKIQNVNASTIRTVMVAHCRRHDNPDLLLDYEAQSQARRQKGQQQQQHRPLLFDLGTSGSEEDEDEETGGEEARLPAHRFSQPSMSGLGHVLQTEMAIESHVAKVMGRAHTKAPDAALMEPSEPGEGEDKTYLLFTTGSLTYSPHQIGNSASKL